MIIVVVTSLFMVLGVFDKLALNGRLGYGESNMGV